MVSMPAAEPRGQGAAPSRLAALDGLRGLAVLIVLASHLSNAGLLPQPGMAGTGKAGVYLFFVLSAFLLTRNLLRSLQGDASARAVWLDYASRRVLRIGPLFLVVLGVSYVLTRRGVAWWPYPMDGSGARAHLMLRAGVDVLWSIPVEFKFYFVLPVLALLLARLRGMAGAFAKGTILLACLIAVSMVVWPAVSAAENDVSLTPYLPVFLSGCLVAWIHENGRAGPVFEHARPLWGLATAITGLALILSVPAVWAWITQRGFAPDLNHRWFLFFGLAWGTLVLCALQGPRWLGWVFARPWLRGIGLISFSLYLWHMPVLRAVQTHIATPWARLPIALLGILLVSIISYRLVERPLSRVRLTGTRQPGAR